MLEALVVPRMSSYTLAALCNRPWVMVPTHGTQFGVDGCTVTHVIPIHILLGLATLWLNGLPLFLAPS
jgi:hypothetical protein